MKLKKFTAHNVRGYLNFDINFSDSLTFLIGINGSGKTTAIKLLLGLLAPSFKELCLIDFDFAQLDCLIDNDKKQLTIKAIKKNEKIYLSLLKGKESLTDGAFDVMSKDYLRREKYEKDYFEHCENLFNQSPVVQKIRALIPPLFLGLDRKMSEDFSRYDYFQSPESILHRKVRISNSNTDYVNRALFEVQDLVYDCIRQIAKKQPEYSSDFRNQIFTESFTFQKNKQIGEHTDYVKELTNIVKREKELDEAISNLDMKDISTQIKKFFMDIKSTLEILTKQSSFSAGTKDKVDKQLLDALFNWIVNSYQLDRIDKIIEYSKVYQSQIQKLNEPISRLQESVNMFLNEGKKKLIITGDGELKILISTPKKTITNSIFELSSGEKQIIIMIAHLIFFSRSKSSIFVIDEPELSLHISWQEIFVDALLKASPNTQFVLATHAPSIIAKQEREVYCEDLSAKIINC